MKRIALAGALVLTACSQPAAKISLAATTTSSTTSTTSTTTSTVPPEPARPDPARTTTTRASRSAARPRPPVSPPAPTVAAGSTQASWYARGARTASGDAYNPDGLTFAHRTMSFGTRLQFCHNGRCVTAVCTDRGPAAWTGRSFDLSRGAFAAIAPLSAGVVTVTWGRA